MYGVVLFIMLNMRNKKKPHYPNKMCPEKMCYEYFIV